VTTGAALEELTINLRQNNDTLNIVELVEEHPLHIRNSRLISIGLDMRDGGPWVSGVLSRITSASLSSVVDLRPASPRGVSSGRGPRPYDRRDAVHPHAVSAHAGARVQVSSGNARADARRVSLAGPGSLCALLCERCCALLNDRPANGGAYLQCMGL